jgi:hypothetical protein
MKTLKIILYALAILGIGMGCEKKKDNPSPGFKFTFTIMPTSLNYSIYDSKERIEGARVDIFKTEIDYLANQNVFKTTNSDASGVAIVYLDSDKQFWYRVSKDTLNSLRSRANSKVIRMYLMLIIIP